MIYPEVLKFIDDLKPTLPGIPEERKKALEKVAGFIARKRKSGEKANLIYICTHNSRRSHFGQIWAQVLANYFGFDHVQAFSGGTEATAFNPIAIKAISSAGFKVIPSEDSKDPINPVLEVYYGESPKVVAFSKKYDHPANPVDGFCAIMTCSDADENCPFIPGASLRVATAYEDPKKFDNTPHQAEKYTERCRQIASEIYFMYSLIYK
ncbi:protein-tyrosine-phosphatase [soil metagenome]